MSHIQEIFLLSGCIIIIYSFCIALDNESLTIHPFMQSERYCIDCHVKNNKDIGIDKDPACAQLCISCHKEMQNHHAIDLKILEKLPDEFVLTGKNRLSCVTCHDLKIRRFDNLSWKAESLYEKVFKGEKKYKTYYLVKKNNKGQLCKTCH